MTEHLTQLGQPARIPENPDAATLESVPNPTPEKNYLIRFTCPEFTALCPLTGQPDFAHIVIDYIARKNIVESKSLKLFMNSFRNHGCFHEACTMLIAQRLVDLLDRLLDLGQLVRREDARNRLDRLQSGIIDSGGVE